MTSTVETLEDFCEFGDRRVYVLMAIARKKENEDITSGSEIVFREVVKDKEDIGRKVEKLRNASKNYGGAEKFRLYISANARDTLKGYFRFKGTMDSWIEDRVNGQDDTDRKMKRIDSHWKSELQKPHCRDETLFIYDLDVENTERLEVLKEELSKHTEIVLERETPNGFHVVVKPFNHNEIKLDFEVERKNDGMIFLEML